VGLPSTIAERSFQEYGQRVSQAAMSFKFKFPNQLPHFPGVRPIGAGKIEGNGFCFAG
jgi:hypothetical protein